MEHRPPRRHGAALLGETRTVRDDNKIDGVAAVFWIGYLLLIGGITYLAGWGWSLSIGGTLLIVGALIAINDD